MITRFWDMDNTVINNDCDVSWKEFMILKGLCGEEARVKADEFYEQYKREALDINSFLRFQLEEFKGQTVATMQKLCQEHCDVLVASQVYPKAIELINSQKNKGEKVVLLTATNRFIAEPVAKLLGIDEILATELEIVDGKFSGDYEGVYCCGAGKITHIEKYLAKFGGSLKDTAYYGDSSNDIVILEHVGHPFAVNPGSKLREVAQKKGWNILDFK